MKPSPGEVRRRQGAGRRRLGQAPAADVDRRVQGGEVGHLVTAPGQVLGQHADHGRGRPRMPQHRHGHGAAILQHAALQHRARDRAAIGRAGQAQAAKGHVQHVEDPGGDALAVEHAARDREGRKRLGRCPRLHRVRQPFRCAVAQGCIHRSSFPSDGARGNDCAPGSGIRHMIALDIDPRRNRFDGRILRLISVRNSPVPSGKRPDRVGISSFATRVPPGREMSDAKHGKKPLPGPHRAQARPARAHPAQAGRISRRRPMGYFVTNAFSTT